MELEPSIFGDLATCAWWQLALAAVFAGFITMTAYARCGRPPTNSLTFVSCWVGGLVWMFGMSFRRWESYTFPVGLVFVLIAIGVWTWSEGATPGGAPAAPPKQG